jgi:ribosomal protein L40E
MMLTLRAPEDEGSYSYHIELRVSGNASIMDQADFDLNVSNDCPLPEASVGICHITDLRLAYPPAFSESFPVEPPKDVTYGVGFRITIMVHYEFLPDGTDVLFGLEDRSFILERALTDSIELSGSGDYTYFFVVPGSFIPPRNGPWRLRALIWNLERGFMYDSREFQVNVVGAPEEPSGAGEEIDWSISGLQVMPFQPLQGSEAVFQALIQANPTPTELRQVEVACRLDDQELFSDYITYEPGETFHGVQSVPWTVTLGTHTLTWEVDPNEEYNDGNRRNNVATLEFTVVEEFVPPPPEEGEERPLPEEEFNFYVAASPTEQKLASSITYTINVNLLSGNPQPVQLELIGVPAGVSYYFTPSSEVPNYESKLTLTASSRLPAGRYELTINASGGGRERFSPIAFTVEEGPEYSLSITPDSARAKPGETVEFIIKSSSNTGYNQYINLMVSGLPSGVTWRLEPMALMPNSQSRLSLELSKDAKPGVYTITVTGSGADAKRVFATLRIEGAIARAERAEERMIDYLAIGFIILILTLVIVGAFLAIRRFRAVRKPKIFCIECGAKLTPGLEYCPKCGTKQPKSEEGG